MEDIVDERVLHMIKTLRVKYGDNRHTFDLADWIRYATLSSSFFSISDLYAEPASYQSQ